MTSLWSSPSRFGHIFIIRQPRISLTCFHCKLAAAPLKKDWSTKLQPSKKRKFSSSKYLPVPMEDVFKNDSVPANFPSYILYCVNVYLMNANKHYYSTLKCCCTVILILPVRDMPQIAEKFCLNADFNCSVSLYVLFSSCFLLLIWFILNYTFFSNRLLNERVFWRLQTSHFAKFGAKSKSYWSAKWNELQSRWMTLRRCMCLQLCVCICKMQALKYLWT